MEKGVFIDGTWVVLRFLEEIIKKENQDKTVRELLEEKRLLGAEQYLVNPSLLIGSLYGTFLVQYKQEENDKISKAMSRCFEIKYNRHDKDLCQAIRNALAHYNIELENRNQGWTFIFKDKYPEDKEFHFAAEASIIKLRILLEEISQII